MKKMLLIVFLFAFSWMWGSNTFAVQADPTFELLPEATEAEKGAIAVKDLSDVGSSKNFSQKYNNYARELGSDGAGDLVADCAGLGNQFATGIMNRDTILCLAAQVVRFISNMAMVVGALMIIYAGYIYAMSVFNSDEFGVGKGHEAIKRAIVGIVVVIFSYAIINFVIEAFL